jgi:hypothetical protein
VTAAPPALYRADWRGLAACVGQDTDLFFVTDRSAAGRAIRNQAKTFCNRCPVRAECLYDALEHETPGVRPYGIRAGLVAGQRSALAIPQGPRADAVASLRTLLNQIDQHERSAPTMTNTPATSTLVEPPTEQLSVGQILKWADDHPDSDVRDQAARARAALTGLRQRHAKDQELTAITTEAEQLEKRLAELRAREAELAPAKPKKRGSYVRDYDTRDVRAWADASGVACPRVGQIPKRVLDAWRAANSPAAA